MTPTIRTQVDQLLAVDAILSLLCGVLLLGAPHGIIKALGGASYNHDVHEALRYVVRSRCNSETKPMRFLGIVRQRRRIQRWTSVLAIVSLVRHVGSWLMIFYRPRLGMSLTNLSFSRALSHTNTRTRASTIYHYDDDTT